MVVPKPPEIPENLIPVWESLYQKAYNNPDITDESVDTRISLAARTAWQGVKNLIEENERLMTLRANFPMDTVPTPTGLDEDVTQKWNDAYIMAYTYSGIQQGAPLDLELRRARAAEKAWNAVKGREEIEPYANVYQESDGLTEHKRNQYNQFINSAVQYSEMGRSVWAAESLKEAAKIKPVSETILRTVQRNLQVNDEKYTRAPEMVQRRVFTEDQRENLAKSGKALPDGSYPIENGTDLKNAIQAIGRAKNRSRAIAHIIKRAKALGMESLIPKNWMGKREDKSLAGIPDWWVDKTANRINEMLEDTDLLERTGGDLLIDRPVYRSSTDWVKTPDKTLKAEVNRRAIRRNYFQAADDMRLQGWESYPLQRETGELGFKRVNTEGITERAILVRRTDAAVFKPKIMVRFLSGTGAAKLDQGEARLGDE